MTQLKTNYQCIVIGAGHAGCEAGLALARLGIDTLMLATNLDTVAYCACNPSIGGTAKGQIVREIDALGGQMGINTDKSLLQIRMLNQGKGPAVHSPRAQVDKHAYHHNMKLTLENTQGLTLRQAEATSIHVNTDGDYIVTTAVGIEYGAKAVVLCCGVYLNSRIIVGKMIKQCGPNGFSSATQLTQSLINLGYTIKRFKTGTPARINKNSIDFSVMEEQKGENIPTFSFMSTQPRNSASCYLTYSTQQTKKVILDNKQLAPIYSGEIDGIGPRYCPSIEDKIIRFADKQRHQIFLEPEGDNTNEYYVQGVSSSMPADIQYQIYTTIKGLENVQIMRDAYAIEYDCIDATALYPTLQSKQHAGMFFAGQINGTSGYEEAGAQGIVVGINCARYLQGKSQIIFRRDNSYIGVLIDDITTKEGNEPYRMMTSRAEHRLILRQDNADIRLTQLGRDIGLVDDDRYNRFIDKLYKIHQVENYLDTILSPAVIQPFFDLLGENQLKTGITVRDCLKRTSVSINELFNYLDVFQDMDSQVTQQVEINVKYKGYIDKQLIQIEQAERMESRIIPTDIDYGQIKGLRIEAMQKLDKIRPLNIGQAGRISGVSPADITVLLVYLSRGKG
ncbi:MAG: tRNA uridine-5-carboxymethylaminomethyl(34) synthesis enzyme MnmG [Clostridia bacterium]|nr:tRNA uridine-5-carboxymethylaminomethyl(34) synthesis enzyme MnmG [Clostridia bacterium]